MKRFRPDRLGSFEDPVTPLMRWPQGWSAPPLPKGFGGIAVRTRRGARFDMRRGEPARNVGVNGRPLWYGWGRMIAVVPPGEHLVEVREESVEGACWVSVRAGDLVELDYVAPRSRSGEGLLGPAPVRRVGTTRRPFVLSFAAVVLVLAGVSYTRFFELLSRPPRFTLFVAAALSLALAVPWWWTRRRRIGDERYRAAMSDEARLVTDAASRKPGDFLGITPRTVPDPGPAHSGLIIQASLRHTLSPGRAHAGLQCSWLPDPRLWINGRKRPVSWATWWYELPPGRHEIEVWLPTTEATSTSTRNGEEHINPLTVPVDIAAGETRRLDIEVRAHSRVNDAHLNLFEDGGHRKVERDDGWTDVDVTNRVSVTTR